MTIERQVLPAGVSVVRATDARDGRFLRLLFPIDAGVIVRSTPGSQDMVGRSDMAWLTNWNTYSLYVANPATVVSVLVPARILDESADSSRELPIVAASTLWLRNPVREFVRSITADGAPRERLPQYLVEKLIFEMTLSLLLETQGMSKISATAERGLHARAMAYIAAYKSDTELTPAKVAGTMNISLRQLQRAFAAENSSITEEIRQHRVETAAGLLADPAYRHLDLTQIAQHAGFGSPAEMRRAIAAVHGCTPSQLRVTV
ncbi:AraC family transcriptional regulator [Subtercola sp. YIM 133946]|uniref:AraC family transcriptional regulator n=1 Tax=Subtercola sp. YIM 133946 TaxID=3118909 RepID=UPI002F93346F